MKEQILKIADDLRDEAITTEEAQNLLLGFLGRKNHVDAPGLKAGYVKIEGCDNATGFQKICKESELQKVGKEIYAERPGQEGYYNFTKYLWVQYPDDRPECRLDDVVPYDE